MSVLLGVLGAGIFTFGSRICARDTFGLEAIFFGLPSMAVGAGMVVSALGIYTYDTHQATEQQKIDSKKIDDILVQLTEERKKVDQLMEERKKIDLLMEKRKNDELK